MTHTGLDAAQDSERFGHQSAFAVLTLAGPLCFSHSSLPVQFRSRRGSLALSLIPGCSCASTGGSTTLTLLPLLFSWPPPPGPFAQLFPKAAPAPLIHFAVALEMAQSFAVACEDAES